MSYRAFRKYYLLSTIILLVIAINLIFWYWTSRDSGFDVINPSVAQTNWREFSERNLVQFSVPKSLLKEESQTGAYWFDPRTRKAAIVYEKFTRDESLSFDQHFTNNVLNPEPCQMRDTVNNLKIYKNCPYLDSLFSFASLEKQNKLIVVSFNQNYLSPEIISYIINSIEY